MRVMAEHLQESEQRSLLVKRLGSRMQPFTPGAYNANRPKWICGNTYAGISLTGNDPDMLRANKVLDLLTNAIGADDNFIGADAAAAWWQRNFRM